MIVYRETQRAARRKKGNVMNLVKVCTNCGEDFGRSVCPHCGCDDYDYACADDVAERRTGGLDEDC